MTVPSTTNRNDYVGSGTADSYDYTFKVLDKADLLVTQRDTDDIEATLTLDTDYTVSGVGESGGGSITLTAGNLPSGHALTIRRNPEMVQETDLRNQGAYYADDVETALDRLTMIDQRQQVELDRSVKLPETSTGVSAILPIPAAGKMLRWNEAGDGIDAIAPGSVELAEPADASVTPAKLSDVTPAADKLPYFASAAAWALAALTAAGRTLIGAADAAAQRAAMGLGSLATLNTAPIANGGTGESTASAAFSALKQAATMMDAGVVELATKAEAEAGTDSARVAALDQLKHHRGVAKAWVQFTLETGSPVINDSYNVSSITDLGSSGFEVNFTTPFANADYCYVASAQWNTDSVAAGGVSRKASDAKTTTKIQMRAVNTTNGADTDLHETCIAFYGAQ